MSNPSDLTQSVVALVDDPAWVRAQYEEAKELISELREAYAHVVSDDLRDRIEDFYLDTFLDRCTTLGRDCGCNTRTEQS